MVKIRKSKKDSKGFSQENPLHPPVISGCLKTTESHGSGILKDTGNTSLVSSPSCGQSRREKLPLISEEIKETGGVNLRFVPVITKTGKSLMPCHPARARKLLKKEGNAVRRFHAGIFHLCLLCREDGEVQRVGVGIDPGSKREGFTVKSSKHTFENVLTDAVSHVKESVETRKDMRRGRRFRKTPCRKNRENRSRGGIPPSTKARWQAKLRVVNILRKLYPVVAYAVEDIQASTKPDKRKWNSSFSPLEVGKKWFYSELEKLGELKIMQGWEVKELRDKFGLKKTKAKLDDCFSAHNVDSWILANSLVGGHVKPDNERIMRLIPLRFYRRQLHVFQPSEGNIRRNYGSTMSNGLKRGSLVDHEKHGVCYLGGFSEKTGLSLHNLNSGERLCRNAKEKDMVVLSYNYFRWYKA